MGEGMKRNTKEMGGKEKGEKKGVVEGNGEGKCPVVSSGDVGSPTIGAPGRHLCSLCHPNPRNS
jgi:hypothetical protein